MEIIDEETMEAEGIICDWGMQLLPDPEGITIQFVVSRFGTEFEKMELTPPLAVPLEVAKRLRDSLAHILDVAERMGPEPLSGTVPS